MQALLNALTYAWTTFGDSSRGASLPLAVLLLLLISAWLGAACWASSLAEARGKSPVVHFLIGLAIPFVYPFMLAFGWGAQFLPAGLRPPAAAGAATPAAAPGGARVGSDEGASIMSARAGADLTPSAPAPGDTPSAPAPGGTPAAAPGSTAFDLAYFRRLAADPQQSEGPWLIRYGGSEVIAQRIVEALPQAAVVEVDRPGGGSQRIRVPYARVESCSRL